MQSWMGLIMLPTVGLFAVGWLPVALANRRVKAVTRWVQVLAITQVVAAAVALVNWLVGGGVAVHLPLLPPDFIPYLPPDLMLLGNGATVLMFALISFVGWVICRYSVRYLDGDPNQGRFFKQLSLTLGCVALMVWSSSLLTFTMAWFAVSLALHPLLLHCGHRPGARQAAWMKFTISRTGELLLFAATVMLWREFGTTSFTTLAESASTAGTGAGISLSLCRWLVVLAVILKTAQFPFHAWLPQTLDTPTPVSALMHAGVVNAGGFLMIRVGPWFVGDSSPLMLLTAVGTLTAMYGAVVMTTQPTIKQQLAYSTVAQMGFMLLQCGLGAFSAAMLHLIAHSLYKAHAFLASGSVLSDRQVVQVTEVLGRQSTPLSHILPRLLIGAFLLAVSATLLTNLGSSKAGALPLLLMWGMAVLYYVATALGTRDSLVISSSLVAAGVMANVYSLSLWMVQLMMQNDMPSGGPAVASSLASAAIVLTGFACLIAWHGLRRFSQTSPWISRLYVHALNGFYLEAYWRKWLPIH